jgi:hypothetical protein
MKQKVLLFSWVLCTLVLPAAMEEFRDEFITPPPTPATNAPSEEPTMLFFPNPSPGRLPGVGPDPCPPSSICLPDYNLMHRAFGTSCTNDCVPDARVGRKKVAGWKCDRTGYSGESHSRNETGICQYIFDCRVAVNFYESLSSLVPARVLPEAICR